MKILTNIQSVQVGGITQALASFKEFLSNQNDQKVEIIGIDVLRKYTKGSSLLSSRKVTGPFTIITQELECEKIQPLLETLTSLKEVQKKYQHIVEYYRKVISEEKPDLIVINGTYFIPWCLYLAARETRVPLILHYHGILTKETETWTPHARKIMKEMEQTFDNKRLYYIFPSLLSKKVVEEEVFGHSIAQSAILPNSIQDHYFDISTKGSARNIGVVGRWSPVKNPEFIKKFVKYNEKMGGYFNITIVTDTSLMKEKDKKASQFAKVLSPMDATKLAKFYGRMGMVLCPSHFETYGNVPQEAVASGTPAFVSSNMGVSETFRKVGLDNLIIDFHSVKAVYDKVKQMSTSRIENITREEIKQEVSTDSIHTKLLSIYKKALL